MIHRDRNAIVVTRGNRETRLRTENDVLDFVGPTDERRMVVRLWDEIQKDARRLEKAKLPSGMRVGLDEKDHEVLASLARGERVPNQGPRIGRLKRLGYLTEDGKVVTKKRARAAESRATDSR